MTQEEFHKRYEYKPATDCLGEGGFGKVFKAYDTHLDKWVAIKMADVKPGLEHVRLKHEVDIVNKLPTHPNIARYEECFTFSSFTGEYDFAVLQYYESGNLQQLLETTQLTEQQKDSILRQILAGIEFLHNQGIIHRDLKPQNILIVKRNGEYIPKITDFGISKKLDINKSSVFTNSLSGVGTLAYASPEQLTGNTIRKNTDLWSFGVIACWMFTGKLPFNSAHQSATSEAGRIELFKQITSGDISSILLQLPSAWQSLVKQCIVVNVEKRISGAGYCLEVLSGIINPNNNEVPTGYKNSNCETIIDTRKTVILENKVANKETVTDIDGNVYKTMRIGNQVWMAENLRVSRYRNGDSIPNIKDENEWKDLKTGAYCYYNNNPEYYDKLYNWFAVNDKRNIAPIGWHIASDDECTLMKYYFAYTNDSIIDKDKFIKSRGGKRNNEGVFNIKNQIDSFWSSNEGGNNPIPLWIIQIPGDLWEIKSGNTSNYAHGCSFDDYVDLDLAHFIDFTDKTYGLSVRCVKDNNLELSSTEKSILSTAKEQIKRRKKTPIRLFIAIIASIIIIYVIGIIYYISTSESMNSYIYVIGGGITFSLFSKWIDFD